MGEPSDALMDLAMIALDHAANSVVDSGGPLVPFALTEQNGQRSLQRFAVGPHDSMDLEESVAAARQAVRDREGLDGAAVAWDGYLTVEGERTDAVFVEASEARATESIILAQRYGVAGRLRKSLRTIGNPAQVGHGEPMF